MRITLVTTSFNDMVHGTFNDKKTGCGINLLKPDTASRFTRAGDMTYLGEITCEKCKAKIAKEMIKADSKEMKALLKEEKMRAKRGLEDEGLVALADLEVRPTSRQVDPEPRRQRELERPAPPPPPVNPNANVNRDNPAYTDDLSQFAIEKPQQYEPEPPVSEPQEDDFLKQFAIEKPETPQYEAPQEEDDFLKQFAIEKPETPQYEAPQEEDDFLKQFSFKPEEPQYGYQPEPPVQPPVIDDISDAISAMQNNTYNQPVEEETVNNDILSMFAVENPQKTNDYNSYEEDESIYDSMKSDDTTESNENEWDIIANQLFADTSGNAKQPQPQQPAFDDISVPEIEDIVSPKLDDISIDDIIAPTKNMTAPANDVSIDDILKSANNLNSQPVQPAQSMTPPPVQQTQPMTPPPVQPQAMPQMTPPPVQPQAMPQMTPPPVQPQAMPQMTPPPIQPQAMPQMHMPQAAIGQIITVPQISGYDQNGQPMYAYAQMLVQGYDPNGQPILMPIPTQPIMGMQMPAMAMPTMAPQQHEYSSLDKNSRLQAVLASLDEPVAEKDMTVGQKIAAANAAKGSPVSANVSKIATNEHSKSANQAFINAISESKEATQSLTETQGIKPKGMVLDSIEDVLSQLGDNSLKEQKAAQQARMQQNVPVFDEYKGPTSRRSSSSSFSRPVPSSRSSSSSMSDMPLTRAQMKEKKKQDKIDAKFQKEMAKRQK